MNKKGQSQTLRGKLKKCGIKPKGSRNIPNSQSKRIPDSSEEEVEIVQGRRIPKLRTGWKSNESEKRMIKKPIADANQSFNDLDDVWIDLLRKEEVKKSNRLKTVTLYSCITQINEVIRVIAGPRENEKDYKQRENMGEREVKARPSNNKSFNVNINLEFFTYLTPLLSPIQDAKREFDEEGMKGTSMDTMELKRDSFNLPIIRPAIMMTIKKTVDQLWKHINLNN